MSSSSSLVTRTWTRLLLGSAILVCVAGAAWADDTRDWTPRDWALQSTYTALHVLDWSQSLSIARSPDRAEANPFLGAHPSPAKVNAYFGGTLAAHWLISALLPPKARGVWQCFTIVLEGQSVARNFAVGVRLSLP
jgi:hypothetical protein